MDNVSNSRRNNDNSNLEKRHTKMRICEVTQKKYKPYSEKLN